MPTTKNKTQKCEERNINRIFWLRETQQNIFFYIKKRESKRRILIIIYYDRKKERNFCITYEMCLEIEEYNKENKVL